MRCDERTHIRYIEIQPGISIKIERGRDIVLKEGILNDNFTSLIPIFCVLRNTTCTQSERND